ncbi:MAG: 30S ribosomal protein S7 [Phycisphaerae bacterium]|nr:30S ribosomal protein S7 [Phycisphaerae bacterium]
MAKRQTASESTLRPDPKYGSKLAAKFINCMMWEGKKTVAERIFYGAMDLVTQRVKDASAAEIFETAINNIKPTIEVRSKRVGGANYQVPMQVNRKRQQSLAFRWLIGAARDKKGKPMHEKLAGEILDAFNNTGAAVTTKENVHRMAEANKAFAHFAW